MFADILTMVAFLLGLCFGFYLGLTPILNPIFSLKDWRRKKFMKTWIIFMTFCVTVLTYSQFEQAKVAYKTYNLMVKLAHESE